jgi:hypothetical protein
VNRKIEKRNTRMKIRMKIKCNIHNVHVNAQRGVESQKSTTYCIGFAFRMIAGVLMTSDISVKSPVREWPIGTDRIELSLNS